MNTVTRAQYTAEEVIAQTDKLPGFESQGDIYRILADMPERGECRWQTVLSATVVTRLNDKLHILTGSRSAEGNATHVNVASTPTMRIPPQEAGFLIHQSIPFNLGGIINPSRPFVSESLYPSVATLPDNTDVLAAKVGYLLALKLELGAVLERTQGPIGRTSLARSIAGFSYLQDNESGEPLYEPLIMLGAVVGLEAEIAREIPQRTKSYDYLGWTAIDSYVHGVATKNLTEVLTRADSEAALEVCVRGLCNATSSVIAGSPEEIQHHLTEEGMYQPF